MLAIFESEVIMRRLNYSAPIPSGQPRGQRKNVCDKKGGAMKNEVKNGLGNGKWKD